APAKTDYKRLSPDVLRALQYATQTVIPARIAAQLADLCLAQGAAARAVTHPSHRRFQCMGQLPPRLAVAFKQVQRHALCGFGTYPGQAPQGVDQLTDQRAETHCSVGLLRRAS